MQVIYEAISGTGRSCDQARTLQANRTGVNTISFPGAMLRYDLQEGFPAITTRRMAFKSAIGEMVGFLRGVNNAAEFRELGCKVWDQNANENAQWLNNPFRKGEDDLGEIYGVQWRKWPAYKRIDAGNVAAIELALGQGIVRLPSPKKTVSLSWSCTRPSTRFASASTPSSTIQAAGGSCSMAGTAHSSMKWPCRRATCCTSCTRTRKPAKSR